MTNRRHTFTMPRSRPSLSGIYNNIATGTSEGNWGSASSSVAASPSRPGSYIPPHRRSMSSAQPSSLPSPSQVSRPPPSLPRNMPNARAVDRRNSLSDRARSWRRTESEDLPRFTPQESNIVTPDVSATAVVLKPPPVQEGEPESAAVQLQHALASIKSTVEKSSSEEEDEESLRAAPYYQMATASSLFKPANIGCKDPVESADQEHTCSLSDDDFVWPSHRSHPIPIRASRDSRPSVDNAQPGGPPKPVVAEGEHLAEKNQVDSSVESLVSSGSDASDGTPAEDLRRMERPSSLMFPWSGILCFYLYANWVVARWPKSQNDQVHVGEQFGMCRGWLFCSGQRARVARTAFIHLARCRWCVLPEGL